MVCYLRNTMLPFLRIFITSGVMIHLFLLLAESSYFGDLFAFIGHTGLLITHIIILALITVAALPGAFGEQLKSRPFLNLSLCSLLYAAWVVFCSLPSVHTTDRLCELILSPLTIAALFLCAPSILERQHYRSIFLSFAAILGLHTFCVLWIMFKNDPTFFGRQVIAVGGRPKFLGTIQLPMTDGIFRSPNGIGSFLALFPAILLSEFMVASRRHKAALVVTGILITFGLFLTYCRAAEASVLVGLLLPAIMFLKKSPAKCLLACSAILIMTVIVSLPDQHQWSFLNSSMAEHNTGPDAVTNSTAFVAHTVTSRRTEIWSVFLGDWLKHPFLGAGLMGFDYLNLGPHSFLLANLVYFGVPGLLLIATLLFLAIKQVIARIGEQPKVLAPILGGLAALILVHGSLEYSITHPEYFTNSLFWLLLGYACFTKLGQL